MAGVAALLWVTSGVMRARGIGVRGKGRRYARPRRKSAPEGGAGGQVRQAACPQGDDDLDDMDDIEAILKRHGI